MQALKKLTALLLVLSMIFALAACSGAGGKNNIFDTKGTEAAQKTETEPTPEETKKATEPPVTEAPDTEPATTEPATTEPEDTQELDPNDPFAEIGSPALDAAFVGSWIYMLDYATLMEASAGDIEQLDDMTKTVLEAFSDLQMDVLLDLRADGTFVFGIDEDSARAAVDTIIPRMGEIMLPLILNMMGMTEEQLAAALEAEGMTMEEFMDQMMAEMQSKLNPDDMVASMTESTKTGSWRFLDGKLYLVEEGSTVNPENYMEVTLENGTLTVTAIPNSDVNDEMYKKMIPMVFTRK